jgi:hypothetical protein
MTAPIPLKIPSIPKSEKTTTITVKPVVRTGAASLPGTACHDCGSEEFVGEGANGFGDSMFVSH